MRKTKASKSTQLLVDTRLHAASPVPYWKTDKHPHTVRAELIDVEESVGRWGSTILRLQYEVIDDAGTAYVWSWLSSSPAASWKVAEHFDAFTVRKQSRFVGMLSLAEVERWVGCEVTLHIKYDMGHYGWAVHKVSP